MRNPSARFLVTSLLYRCREHAARALLDVEVGHGHTEGRTKVSTALRIRLGRAHHEGGFLRLSHRSGDYHDLFDDFLYNLNLDFLDDFNFFHDLAVNGDFFDDLNLDFFDDFNLYDLRLGRTASNDCHT